MDVHSLSSDQYTSIRFWDLVVLENQNLQSYHDSSNIPSIGIGFDLQIGVVLDKVLTQFGVGAGETDFIGRVTAAVSVKYTTDAAVQTVLNGLMAQRALTHPDARTQFAFTSNNEMKLVFDQLTDTYEGIVNNNFTLANSTERVAFFSLAYNGGDAILGPGLQAAWESGDRAETWYQIRYQSNGDKSLGQAARRMVESDEFNLKTTDHFSQTDALLAFRMYTKHENLINNYENVLYKTAVSNAAVKAATIATDSGVSLDPIAKIGATLAPALSVLEDAYAPGQTFDHAWVAPDVKGGASEVAAHTVDRTAAPAAADLILGGVTNAGLDAGTNDKLSAGKGDDVVLGFGGNDTISGDEGNDSLVGGAGNDQISGGIGNDTIQGGDGNDLLVSQSGSDSMQGGVGDDIYDIRSAKAVGTDVITIDFQTGGGHDYLMTDPLPHGTLTPPAIVRF